MKKLSTCFIVFNTKNNGGNRIIFELGNRLSKRGHAISFFIMTGNKPKWISFENTIGFIGWGNILKHYDNVIATFWPTVYILPLMKSTKKFYFIQGWEMDFYNNIFLKALVNKTFSFKYKIITISDFIEKRVRELNLEIEIENTKGAPISDIFFKTRTHLLKLNQKKISVLSVVSKYIYPKGLDLLAELISNLRKRNGNYKFTLVSTEERPSSSIFDDFISNPTLKKIVSIYQNSNLFILTSRSEGFSLPVIEAMSQGCLVIATNSGGIEMFAKNKFNCLIVEEIDEIWNKNLINKLISDKKLYRKLSRNGINTAKKYRWRDFVIKFEKIIL